MITGNKDTFVLYIRINALFEQLHISSSTKYVLFLFFLHNKDFTKL